MALMEFREPNQVQWIGVRPAHRGTQICTYAAIINGLAIIYTVPAGKHFCLIESLCRMTVAATGMGRVTYQTAGGMSYRTLCSIWYDAFGYSGDSSFCPAYPLELVEGERLVVVSSALVLSVEGHIFGWEE